MKLFELHEGKPRLTEAKRNFNKAMSLCETMLRILEADNFDWDPADPDIKKFSGVKGKTSNSAKGDADRKLGADAQQERKMQGLYKKLLAMINKAKNDGEMDYARSLQTHSKKIEAGAAKRGWDITARGTTGLDLS